VLASGGLAQWYGWHDASVVMLAEGSTSEAQAMLSAAAEAATEEEVGIASAGMNREVAADIALCQAQLWMRRKDWDAAEEALARALSLAEAVSGEGHPRVAAPLVLLADCCARTQRLTLAEGLYRRCLQMLGLAVSAGQGAFAHKKLPVHPSLGAMACWRYSQMLAVMPKRGQETEECGAKARRLWDDSGVSAPLEDVLGGQEALKGTVSLGGGAVVHLQTRRLIPCLSEQGTGE